ncbi:DUF1294 domain-containing protein [Arvimicrobium flavum]|uniref:DUF1294 domain-containing protein n=1 Tax=Arvimicrobium flavum TaxID=3393320 RepID=UPI00237AFBCD|nr:DUF1294 domain-containing protein [Mesorhizobium shangrilense]
MDAVYIVLMLAGINALTFTTCWWDKRLARAGAWRIRESTLLWLAILGGSVGAVTAQQVLRHKTRKEPFQTFLHVIVAVQTAVLAVWLFAADRVAGLFV